MIGAGYTRTGTVSLAAALETLGVGPCLHPLTSPRTRLLDRARRGDEGLDWRDELGDWRGALGWIGARHYRELVECWPDAVVVLSVRDPDAWYGSYASCLRTARELALAGGEQLATAEAVASDALMMLDGPVWTGILDGSLAERDVALERFESHNADVARTVPPERLLVHDVADGWEPLCSFLGLDVPDVAFPHLNERDAVTGLCEPQRTRAPHRGGSSRAGAPRIGGVAVADPGRSYSQEQVLAELGMAGDEFAQRIFARCGVRRRSFTALGDGTLQGRTGEAEARLFELAVRAIDELDVDLDRVGTLVTASLYSLGGPTLGHRLVEHYRLSPSTDKYHVTGVGCASAVPLVRLVAQTLDRQSGRSGLIVAAEGMSTLLSRARPGDPRAKVIGSAIFGDGCAAAVIEPGGAESGPASGPAIVASTVHQIPGSLDVVRMELADDDGFLYLARELPDLAADGLAELVDGFLRPLGLTRHAIDHWLVHPGGRRILETAGDALGLSASDLAVSYDMLAEHGNVGTASIFYVYHEMVRRRPPAPGSYGLMVTVGPGVTVGLMLLAW